MTALANLTLLLLIYAVFGYGLVSIVRWVGRRLWHQLLASFMLLARAVPLLMIFALLAFMSTEMWQVFSPSPTPTSSRSASSSSGSGPPSCSRACRARSAALETEVGDETRAAQSSSNAATSAWSCSRARPCRS